MGKKGKGKKKSKKDSEPTEPPHDPGWERVSPQFRVLARELATSRANGLDVPAQSPSLTHSTLPTPTLSRARTFPSLQAVEQGRWDRPIDALPDPNAWPTWGALRERIILSCMTIQVTWSPSVSDAFASEMVKLAPPELAKLYFRGSTSLTKFVLSPLQACPLLKEIDLSLSPKLEFVLIQSESVEKILLSRCGVKKLLLHCKNLSTLNIEGCTSIETIMIWSDDLHTLDLTACSQLSTCKIHCPNLKERKIPELKAKTVKIPDHPPISKMLAAEIEINAELQKQKEKSSSENGQFEIPIVLRC